MSDWRPIETAPKNGTTVLLYLGEPLDTSDLVGWCPADDIVQVVGWWNDDDWFSYLAIDGVADTNGCSFPYLLRLDPTRWMPLPEAPK